MPDTGIPALGSLRQKVHEFKTSLHYIPRHWLANKNISIPVPPSLAGGVSHMELYLFHGGLTFKREVAGRGPWLGTDVLRI